MPPPPPIPSAYNFVPLNERVFFPEPELAPQPTQDTPYSDGLCGTIKLQIKATTPIYIRAEDHFDKETRKQAADSLGQKYHELQQPVPGAWESALCAMNGPLADCLRAYTDFYRLPDRTYAVPWSEVKGMLRTVVEIASWGKLHGVSKDKMSFRDLRNRKLYGGRFVNQQQDGIHSRSKAGWITVENDEWVLTPCSYARVQIEDLENYFWKTFHRRINLHSEQSAPSKHRQWESGCSLVIKFDLEKYKCWNHDKIVREDFRPLTLCYRLAKSQLGSGKEVGELVMCGQPSTFDSVPYANEDARLRRISNKHMEFIFYKERREDHKPVSDETRQDFESAHQLPPGENPDEWAWGFWREKLKAGERMPVFYLASGWHTAMGLSQLFRINYKHTLWQRLPEDHKSSRPDLAELIFGPISGSENFWRGRVWGQPFVAAGTPQPDPLCVSVLGTPRPSFYPNYLVQPSQGKPYKTLDDTNSELRGWKRYPVPADKTAINPNEPIRGDHGPKMGAATFFKPLPAGTKFDGEISFHNLRPWELGALLWAIGLGQKQAEQHASTLRHSLGMAKPLGCGAVHLTATEITAKDVHGAEQTNVEEVALAAFRTRLVGPCAGRDWEKSVRIKELILMANQSEQPGDLRLLRHPSSVTAFRDFKNPHNPQVLRPFSELPGVQP